MPRRTMSVVVGEERAEELVERRRGRSSPTTHGSIVVTVAVRGTPIASATSPNVSPGSQHRAGAATLLRDAGEPGEQRRRSGLRPRPPRRSCVRRGSPRAPSAPRAVVRSRPGALRAGRRGTAPSPMRGRAAGSRGHGSRQAASERRVSDESDTEGPDVGLQADARRSTTTRCPTEDGHLVGEKARGVRRRRGRASARSRPSAARR